MNKKKIYLLLILILILAFIIRIWSISDAHWWDETVYLENAKVIFGNSNNYNELNFRPPFLSIIFGLGFLIWNNVFMASLIVIILSLIGIFFIFLIGKYLYNKEIGLISSILLSFIPFLVKNSKFLLTDMPSLTFAILFFYYLLKSTDEDKVYLYFLTGLFLALSILTRFTSLFLIFILIIYFIFKKINLKKIIYIFISGFLFLFPYLLWAQIKFGNFLNPFIIARRMVGDNNHSILFYINNFYYVFTLLIIIGFLVWFINFINLNYLSVKKNIKEYKKSIKQKKYYKFIESFYFNHLYNNDELILLIWFIIFIFYISYIPHKELRYLIPITLPLILLSSKGIYDLFTIKNKLLKYFSIFIIMLLMIYSFYPSFMVFSKPLINHYKTNEMKTSKFLKENYKNYTIYTNFNYPVFAYYSGLKTKKIETYNDIFYKNYSNILNKKSLIITYSNINKSPTVNWLNNNSNFEFIKSFKNIFIYKYKK